MVLADFYRGQNRAQINDLANGVPPYTESEVDQNNISVNVNDLSMTRLLHDARAQFTNAFQKPGVFFNCVTDAGPVHKRSEWNAIVTKGIGKRMKKSVPYFESMRSKFGLLTLHGISPAIWQNPDRWCPKPLGVEDVLIPSNTLLGFENLPFFVVRRNFTAYELESLAMSMKRDKGWNMPLVNSCLKWADTATTQLMGNNTWSEIWSPEKIAERRKQDGTYYPSDQVPTVDAFDIYAFEDDGEKSGWIRRIILDAWSAPSIAGNTVTADRKSDMPEGTAKGGEWKKSDFLYTSGSRKVAMTWQEIVSFQFADLSAVAPFKYHSVRSLGFLLYSTCHLQNRLRCKFNEAVFEALMMYFRVKSQDDVQRALKLNLINRGFIDETINPVPASERFQVNTTLVELGIKENSQLIQQHASSYSQPNTPAQHDKEKTKFQVQAEVNASQALVGATIQQAYRYMGFEYDEVKRRFMRENSSDPEVRSFRAEVLKLGVPEKYLCADCWQANPAQVMGGGNKTSELMMAEGLMQMRPTLDPEPQRIVSRDYILALTDDAAKAEMLVPEKPARVTDSTHDAQLAFAALMQDDDVGILTGINHIEYVETMIMALAKRVQKAQQQGGMASAQDIQGFQNVAKHIEDHIKILAQDPEEKARVKKYGDALGKIMNLVKAFAQRLQEAMKKKAQQNGNGGIPPEQAAKVQLEQQKGKVKLQQMTQSHAQRTAQRQLQFEQQMKQDQQRHQAEIAATDLEAASKINRGRMASLDEE